jgi:uncharacterized protein YjbI with pentapeptide repeats
MRRSKRRAERWRTRKISHSCKQGVDAWNQWRAENHEIRPDLTEADLEATLRRADLSGARLSGARLHKADLSGANLSAARLREVDLTEANLSGARLHKADLSGANLSAATLSGATLTEATLFEAGLIDADLIRADLSRATLTGANLRGADLSAATLSGATLTEATLFEAGLIGADLTGADLHQAYLSRAYLLMANLSEAKIGWTTFGDVELSSVRGLETVQHAGPSTIGIDTLYRSRGNIPEVFLRGAGVPDDMITYSKSLVGQPFQYHSCFISYSSRDEALAQRLHADLQDKGVRCWFAPEDLKIGDEFRSRIDESIQVYDRLLLILSEHSVQSRWVQNEVETAFDKEGKENRIVLFPIRLDEAIMHVEVGWAATVRRQRHIGDFRQWKDHDAYQQAFQRLLRDLKADI